MSHPNEENEISLLSGRSVIVFVASAVLIFTGLFAVLEAIKQEQPHIRLGNTGDRFSGLVVTKDARLLILNTGDRAEARSFAGRVARPWEPNPSVVLVTSTERAASGLWEYLQIAQPEQVIVAGIPGSGITWDAVIDLCRTRGISIDYVITSSKIIMEPFTLTVLVSEEDEAHSAAVVIRRNAVNAVVLLEGEYRGIQSQLTVGSLVSAANNLSSVSIDTSSVDAEGDVLQLVVKRADQARVYFDSDRLRIRGVHIQK